MTATLEDFTPTPLDSLAGAFTPPVEQVVETLPTGAQGRDYTRYMNEPDIQPTLFVTRMHTAYRDRPEFVGTYQKVFPAPGSESWYVQPANGALARVYGALVSPPLENGKYYRLLTDQRMLVQYFDDEHTSQRNRAHRPFNIVAGETGPWPFPGDSLVSETLSLAGPYIEAKAPEEVSDVRQDESEEAPDPQFIDGSTDGPTLGLAATNDAGRVAVDPELVPGRQYVLWGGRANQGQVYIGTYMIGHDGIFRISDCTYRDAHGAVDSYANLLTWSKDSVEHWAELKLERPVSLDHEGAKSLLREQAQTVRTEFADLNENMNELASNEDWCEDYERIILPLGMSAREDRKVDWDVTVNVSFTMEEDSPSMSFDQAISDLWDGGSITASSFSITGTATVEVAVSAVDREGAYGQVDSQLVRDRMDDLFPGSIEINDYECTHAEEC